MKNSSPIRNLVTGGAGFLGSHLVDRLMKAGEEVICIDNFFTGRKRNVEHWIGNPYFELIRHDVTEPILLEVDRIWHLACPASPVHYQFNPIKTAKTSFLGTYNMLGLARRVEAKLLLASSSEVYGNPKENPQPESYAGSVNTIGLRSCYDEGKRIAETLCSDYMRMNDTQIRIARIFNTYGPRMLPNDGRVISNFIVQAMNKKKLTIYGDGSQSRSFCYVDDLVDGLIKLMDSSYSFPVNIGNPDEITISQVAKIINNKFNNIEEFEFLAKRSDDPYRRKPLIDLAYQKLKWKPKINFNEGIEKTCIYFRNNFTGWISG